MATKTKIQTHILVIIGAVFFWFCFLCPYKENELGRPGETGLKIQLALAIQIKKLYSNQQVHPEIAAAQKAGLVYALWVQ